MDVELLEHAARQGGLVTSAQAQLLGASRMQLSRMEASGQLERLAQGVYRSTAAPRDRFEHVRLAWMAMEPSTFLEDRAFSPADGVVVAGAAAAALHEMGDLYEGEVSLLVPSARRTRREGIALRARQVSSADVVVAQGLPVLSMTATLADLVELRYDHDQVAEALADAPANGIDFERLQVLLDPLARRNDCRDGKVLLGQLLKLAGLDVDSLLRQAASSEALPLVMREVMSEGALAALGAISAQVQGVGSQMLRQQALQSQQMMLKDVSDAAGRVVSQEAMVSLSAVLEVLAERARPVFSSAAFDAIAKQAGSVSPALRRDGRVGRVDGDGSDA